MSRVGASDLVGIHIRSGVSEKGDPFCTVTAQEGRGRLIVGQLTPGEVRRLALSWLEAAEAAEQDASALRVIRKIGMPDEMAGAIIIELRNSRGEEES